MARFEFDATPSLSPTGAPSGDYENITASPAAFGGQKARALQTLGQGVENVGEAGFNVLKFQNKVDADDQTNRFIETHDKLLYGDPSKNTVGADGKPVPDLGYMGLTGRDASDRREDTLKALKEARESGRNNLKSPEAQLQYDGETRRQYSAAERTIGGHAETQWKSWASDVSGTRATLALDGFVNHLDDPTQRQIDAHTYIDNKVKQTQAKYGADPQITEGAVASAKRDLLKAHTDAVAVKDPAGAIKILQDNKEIAGTQYDDMYGKLRARANQQTGNEIATDAITKGKGGNFAPSTATSIQGVAARYGINQTDLSRAVQIESGGNPHAQTGSYKGLLQLSQGEFDKYKTRPDASIWNPQDNLEAGAAKMRAEGAQFAANFGRQPSGFDSYMIHQQGLAGYSSHLANPNAPAWQNMLSTGEGRQRGERWARDAIWGNIPNQYKATFGNVDNVTSRDFIAMWAQKYGSGATPQFAEGGIPSPYTTAGMQATAGTQAQPVSFNVPTAFNESRGNVEAANFPQPNVAASIKPTVFQNILEDPRYKENPEAGAHALAVARERLNAEEIAENQNAKVRKEANDTAAGDFTTELLNAQTSSKPDYVGMSNRIANDPRLDFKTKHELSTWVNEAAGGKAERTYGPGFWDVFQQVHAPAGDPGKITDVGQLYPLVRAGGPLTIAGFDKLRTEIDGAKTPEGQAEGAMKKQFLDVVARPQITFEDPAFPNLTGKDPAGAARFLGFQAAFFKAYDDAKKAGKTPAELLDPNSREYLGKLIEPFKPSKGESFVDQLKDKEAQPGFFSRLGTAIMGSGTPAKPAFDASTIKSPKDVRGALDARQLTYDEASRILSERFGLRPAGAQPQVPTGP